ncbi:MAG: hypothetical protein WCV84_04600 [Patescibacteria group bacterium]
MCWPDIFVYDKLEEICDSIVHNRRTTIRSGHGVGKSWLMARVAIWFLSVHRPGIVLTTAPTGRQVEKVLWGEIHSAYNASRVPLGGTLLQITWKIDESNYALGFSTEESVNQREFGSAKMQGFHSPNLLIVLDEGAGIAPETWIGATSLLTGENNKLVDIGNPSSPTGPFYETFKSPIYNKIHISCFDHPNVKLGRVVVPGAVTREWIEERKAEWGENSPLYQAKVLGNFPTEGTDTLIPLTWVERAVENPNVKEEGAKSIGCDVARFGDDLTTIYKCTGSWFDLVEAAGKQDTTETAGKLQKAAKDFETEFVAVDDTGVGGGVTDICRSNGTSVIPVNFGCAANDPEKFFNLKAEIYWGLREAFEKENEIRIPNNPHLIGQLASIKFSITAKGQIKIESKDEMKKRGLKSPDHADGLAICFYAKRANWIPEMLWI